MPLLAAIAFVGGVILVVCTIVDALGSSAYGLDARVYCVAAHGQADGADPYVRELPGAQGLAFTYSPFALWLFGPMRSLSCETVPHVMTVATGACALVIGWWCAQWLTARRGNGRDLPWTAQAVLVVTVACWVFVSAPWRSGVILGQINSILMVLILIDLFRDSSPGPVRPRLIDRLPRGVLTGIAAGIKVTPLSLGLFYVARGDWRGLVGLISGFLGTLTIGHLAFPDYTTRFWWGTLWQTERVGDVAALHNVSLKGTLAKLGVTGQGLHVGWLVLCLIIISVAFVAIRGCHRRGQDWAAASAAILVMLLISPTSWNHHWVWVPVILLAFVADTSVHDGSTGPRAAEMTRGLRWLVTIVVFGYFLVRPTQFVALSGANPSAPSGIAVQMPSLAVLFALVLLGYWALPSLARRLRDSERR